GADGARSRRLRARRNGGARRPRARGLGHLQRPATALTSAAGSGGDQVKVDQAYAEVERTTRREARNFAYGIMVLPRPKRRAIAAIYAFARRVDDIADGALPDPDKRGRLEQLHGALEADPGDDAVLVALADARSRYPIP